MGRHSLGPRVPTPSVPGWSDGGLTVIEDEVRDPRASAMPPEPSKATRDVA